MFKHQAFQMIADENGGNRASGFQGYGASVQYVLTSCVMRATARRRRSSTS